MWLFAVRSEFEKAEFAFAGRDVEDAVPYNVGANFVGQGLAPAERNGTSGRAIPPPQAVPLPLHKGGYADPYGVAQIL